MVKVAKVTARWGPESHRWSDITHPTALGLKQTLRLAFPKEGGPRLQSIALEALVQGILKAEHNDAEVAVSKVDESHIPSLVFWSVSGYGQRVKDLDVSYLKELRARMKP